MGVSEKRGAAGEKVRRNERIRNENTGEKRKIKKEKKAFVTFFFATSDSHRRSCPPIISQPRCRIKLTDREK